MVELMAAPVAVALAVDRRRPAWARLAGLVCLSVLLVALGLTYSRGGVIALIVVGPKDLPVLLRKLGQFMAKVRSMAASFSPASAGRS